MSSGKQGIQNTAALIQSLTWNQFETLIGSGAGLPKIFPGLLSADAHVRRQSRWQIDNHVVVQSDLHTAAWPVAKVLVQMLREGAVEGRAEILDILYEIGAGDAPAEITVEKAGQQIPLVAACPAVVASAFDMYVEDCNHFDPEVRKIAGELVELIQKFQ